MATKVGRIQLHHHHRGSFPSILRRSAFQASRDTSMANATHTGNPASHRRNRSARVGHELVRERVGPREPHRSPDYALRNKVGITVVENRDHFVRRGRRPFETSQRTTMSDSARARCRAFCSQVRAAAGPSMHVGPLRRRPRLAALNPSLNPRLPCAPRFSWGGRLRAR